MIRASWFDKFLSLTLPSSPNSRPLQQGLTLLLIIMVGLTIAWMPPLLFLLLVAGGGLGLILLRDPLIALYLLIVMVPFSPLLALTVRGVRVGLMEITLLLGLGGWMMRSLTNRYHPHLISKPHTLFLWPFLILLGAVTLSWLTTFSIAASVVETAKWVEMLFLYLFITVFLRPQQLKWVIITILLVGIVQAGLGLYQFIFKVGPPGFLLFDGRFLRAYGTFAQPNPYAGYLGLILPLALSLTLWAGSEILKFLYFSGSGWFLTGPAVARSGDQSQLLNRYKFPNKPKTSDWQLKIFYLGLAGTTLGLLLAALLASQSRGAWVAFVVAATATVIANSKKPGLIVTGLATVGAIIALVGVIDWHPGQFNEAGATDSAVTAITQRLIDAATIATVSDIASIEVTDANFSTLERLAHWQAGREMWRDHPWLGVGFGNYAAIYPAYTVGRWVDPLGHAHNYFLNIGAEAGLVGILGYLIFWILVFGVTWYVTQKNKGINRAIVAGCFGILVHLHVHNLFDNLYVQGMYLHIAIILALISIISRVQPPLDIASPTQGPLRSTDYYSPQPTQQHFKESHR